MRNQKEINRQAQTLVTAHGSDAVDEARSRMELHMQGGDAKEAGFWLAVMHEIHRITHENMP